MDYHKIKNEEVKLCAERKISGVIAAHSIPTMFYILRKFYGQEELRNMLLHICNIFSVSPLSQTKIISALKNNAFADFEDNLQEECALEAEANYIITRNPKDFKMSRIPTLLPSEFLNMYNS